MKQTEKNLNVCMDLLGTSTNNFLIFQLRTHKTTSVNNAKAQTILFFLLDCSMALHGSARFKVTVLQHHNLTHVELLT